MNASSPASIQNARVSGPQWRVLLLAAVLVFGDFWFGPQIQLGFMHLVPVLLAAWYHGATLGIVLAVVMGGLRFAFHWNWGFPMEFQPTLINTLMRVCVLALLAFGCAKMSQHIRELRRRVSQLERRLPVCVACGVIRRDNGEWTTLDALPEPGSTTLCPRCEEKHYGNGA